jgi:hypothetical protein
MLTRLPPKEQQEARATSRRFAPRAKTIPREFVVEAEDRLMAIEALWHSVAVGRLAACLCGGAPSALYRLKRPSPSGTK